MTPSLSHWGPLEALADQSIDMEALWAWFKSNKKAVQALLDGSAGVVPLTINGSDVRWFISEAGASMVVTGPLELIRLDVRA